MNESFLPILMTMIPTILVSIFMLYFTRAQSKRDKRVESRAAARKKESLLMMKLVMACATLTNITALKLQGRELNGEVQKGLDGYQAAKNEYYDFMNEQATEHLH